MLNKQIYFTVLIYYLASITTVLNANTLINKENINLYQCSSKQACQNSADSYLNKLKKKSGFDFNSLRFATENAANLAAAKTFYQASYDAKREAIWITFEDENATGNSYGYTFPIIANYKQHIIRNVGKLYDSFYSNNPLFIARSLGHTHFDNNECFSRHDLYSFTGKSGKFYLATKSGNVSYIDNYVLKSVYNISEKNLGRYFRRNKANNKTKHFYSYLFHFDTGVYGKYIGNINETITSQVNWPYCYNGKVGYYY